MAKTHKVAPVLPPYVHIRQDAARCSQVHQVSYSQAGGRTRSDSFLVRMNYTENSLFPAMMVVIQSDSKAVFRVDQSRFWAHMG